MANQSGSANPAQVQKYLGGLDYPANREDIIDHAKSQNAPQEILDIISKIDDTDYNSPADVVKEIGKVI